MTMTWVVLLAGVLIACVLFALYRFLTAPPKGTPIKYKPGKTLIGYGQELRSTQKKVRKIFLDDKIRSGHTIVFGTTGVGKSRLAEKMIESDIKRGLSVAVIDPKGDNALLSKIVETADRVGRLGEIILVTPIFPQFSARMDPLSHYYMPEEIVSHIVSGIKSKEQFFVDIAQEVCMVIVQALIIFAEDHGEVPEINVAAILERCSYQDLANMLQQLEKSTSPKAFELVSILKRMLQSPQDYFSKISNSLRTTLTTLSTGNIGSIIGTARSNIFMERLEAGKSVILVVQTGSLLTRHAAHIVGKMLISMIQSFVGRVLASDRVINPPLALYLDEIGSVLYIGIEDIFAKGRAANLWCHGFAQSLADLEAKIGPETAKQIKENCNTQIYMKASDLATAQEVSDFSDTKLVLSPILHLGGGITSKEDEVPVIRVHDMKNLGKRQFYLFTYDGLYKGIVGTVDPSRVKVVIPQLEKGAALGLFSGSQIDYGNLIAAHPEQTDGDEDLATSAESKENEVVSA